MYSIFLNSMKKLPNKTRQWKVCSCFSRLVDLCFLFSFAALFPSLSISTLCSQFPWSDGQVWIRTGNGGRKFLLYSLQVVCEETRGAHCTYLFISNSVYPFIVRVIPATEFKPVATYIFAVRSVHAVKCKSILISVNPKPQAKDLWLLIWFNISYTHFLSKKTRCTKKRIIKHKHITVFI